MKFDLFKLQIIKFFKASLKGYWNKNHIYMLLHSNLFCSACPEYGVQHMSLPTWQ